MVMVAGVAIFALYEASTALSGREQRRVEGAGWDPAAKGNAKVSERQIYREGIHGVVFLLPPYRCSSFSDYLRTTFSSPLLMILQYFSFLFGIFGVVFILRSSMTATRNPHLL